MKNRQGLIDSSVVMALFNEEDRQHNKALEVFETIKERRMVIKICCVTIIEMVSLMKYRKIKYWKKYSNKLIDGSFVVENNYSFTPDDLSWKMTLTEDSIGMVDAIEIEHCLKNKEELITFDKKQETVYKKYLKKASLV